MTDQAGALGTVELVLVIVAGALLAAGALAAVVRIVRGPTLLDRMIASDVLLTTLVLLLGGEMVVNGHTDSVLIMIAITAVAAFATVAVARNVSKQDRTTDAPLPPQTTQIRAEVTTMTAPTPSVDRQRRGAQ